MNELVFIVMHIFYSHKRIILRLFMHYIRFNKKINQEKLGNSPHYLCLGETANSSQCHSEVRGGYTDISGANILDWSPFFLLSENEVR